MLPPWCVININTGCLHPATVCQLVSSAQVEIILQWIKSWRWFRDNCEENTTCGSVWNKKNPFFCCCVTAILVTTMAALLTAKWHLHGKDKQIILFQVVLGRHVCCTRCRGDTFCCGQCNCAMQFIKKQT